MALKNRIDQLIRDEWNKPEIAQLTLWDALETNDQKMEVLGSEYSGESGGRNSSTPHLSSPNTSNGSCVTTNRVTHEPTHEPKPKPTHEPTQWVQEYHVTSHGKKHKYYRYCYLTQPGKIGSCVRVHLPGGNTQNPKAIALKEKVELAIAQRISPAVIEELIRGLH